MSTRFIPRINWGLGLLALSCTFTGAQVAADLKPPFRVEADGQPIDMEYGEAAPHVLDFDGDGKFDLVLGQRSECKMRIYRNVGSNAQPKFGVNAWFRAGGKEASLPGG